MRPFPLILIATALLSACGPNLVGEWSGSCEVGSPPSELELPFAMRVDEQRGGRFIGVGWVDYNGFRFQGDVEGSIDDVSISASFPAVAGGYLIQMNLDGEVGDEIIDGACAFGEEDGDFELESE